MARRLALVTLVAAGVALALVALFVVRSGEDASPEPAAVEEPAEIEARGDALARRRALRRHGARTRGRRARRGPGRPRVRPRRRQLRALRDRRPADDGFAVTPGTPSICGGPSSCVACRPPVSRPASPPATSSRPRGSGSPAPAQRRRATSADVVTTPMPFVRVYSRFTAHRAQEPTEDQRPGRPTSSRCRQRRTGSLPGSSSPCSSSARRSPRWPGSSSGIWPGPRACSEPEPELEPELPPAPPSEPARAGAHLARAVDPGRRRGRSAPRARARRRGARARGLGRPGSRSNRSSACLVRGRPSGERDDPARCAGSYRAPAGGGERVSERERPCGLAGAAAAWWTRTMRTRSPLPRGARGSCASPWAARPWRSSSPRRPPHAELETREPGLIPSGTTGVVVVDLSLSIADEDYAGGQTRVPPARRREREHRPGRLLGCRVRAASARHAGIRAPADAEAARGAEARAAGEPVDADVPRRHQDLVLARARAPHARAGRRALGRDPPRQRPRDRTGRRACAGANGRQPAPELDRAARARPRAFDRRPADLPGAPAGGCIRGRRDAGAEDGEVGGR